MQEEKKIEPLARQLDGPTPPLEIVDEYHEVVYRDTVKELAGPLLLSIFDETGTATTTILDKINSDDRIPLHMKVGVYEYCVGVINDMLVKLAKTLRPEGVLDVRSEEILKETNP